MPRRSIIVFAAICTILSLGLALFAVTVWSNRNGSDAPRAREVATGQPLIGGDFTLVNQDGDTVDQTMLDGKWSLVFFGFTYCPDYCPTTLGVLNAVQEQLGDDAKDLQIVFISIDPARDTPQMLKDYLSSEGFPKGVIGLTGTQEQVDAAAKAYRVYYKKEGTGEGYTMNHTLTVYLMGPDGQLRSPLAHDLGPDKAVGVIRRVMARG
ncbi:MULTISPECIES: SCO family protein [unclassified Brevundimonas]|uniref:SCO family protein n=1 Tax=unclassified Brevundimonas TaxID=2622653 RepID=UPI0025C1FE73|nr:MULTISPECIES: SCO family protein [unclassified Brevundimonas]